MTYSRHLDDERPFGLKSRVFSIARRHARRLGLVDRKRLAYELPPVDLRDLGLSPEEALERAGEARFVIDLPLAWCRGLNAEAFPLAPGAGHPYLETARLLLSRPDAPYEETPLCAYYRAYQPRTAAERLGLAPVGPVLSAPPEIVSMPWHEPRTEADLARRRASLRAENLAHGAAIDHDHGFMDFGPVSAAKGALAIARLNRLLRKISEEGFRLLPGRTGLCRALILISGSEHRAVLAIGQHRAAALAALGDDALPVWPLPEPVRREEVATWPGVARGVFTPEAALEIFDRVFDGRQPAGLDAARFVHRPAPVFSQDRAGAGRITPRRTRSGRGDRLARLDRSESST